MATAQTLILKVEIPDFDMVEHLRDLADQHHQIALQLEEMANRQARIEDDPGFAAKIAEAEDQVMGDDLLSDAQDRGGAEDGTSTPPADMQDRGGAEDGTSTPPAAAPPAQEYSSGAMAEKIGEFMQTKINKDFAGKCVGCGDMSGQGPKEDQVLGDDLLSDAQDRGGAEDGTSTPPQEPVCDCVLIGGGRHHGACPVEVAKRRSRNQRPNGPPDTPPPDMRH